MNDCITCACVVYIVVYSRRIQFVMVTELLY